MYGNEKELQQIDEISRNARKIFVTMLLACVYYLLTIAKTTDVPLLINSRSSPLPIRVVGRQILKALEAIVERVPIVKSVYGSRKEAHQRVQPKPNSVESVVPEGGVERTSYTFVSRFGAGVGFGSLLTACDALRCSVDW